MVNVGKYNIHGWYGVIMIVKPVGSLPTTTNHETIFFLYNPTEFDAWIPENLTPIS